VAVFSSATCQSCAKAVEVARVLESDQVAVDDVEVGARKAVHDRYGIEAVPTIVVADGDGVVRASFVGPPTATDLWAAVAEVREPGSTPGECSQHFHGPPAS
jgi:thioredoxin-like negative regulator of GroEL